MASDESMTALSSVHSSMHDLDVDGYLPHDYTTNVDEEEEVESVAREGSENVRMDMIRMSRLCLESTWEGAADADSNTHVLSDHAVDRGASSCDDEDDGGGGGGVTWASTNNRSVPGSPSRCTRQRAGSTKEYASESEVVRGRHGSHAQRKGCGGVDRGRSSFSYSSYHHRRTRRTRQRRLDLAWEMRRCHRGGDGSGAPDTASGGSSSSPCVVVRTTGPGAGCMWMDVEEVKACRDLGLELPCDWTVEIPPSALTAVAAAADAASGGGDSPVGSWHVSSPGEDPDGEMRARLRLWAQAVALTCLPPEQLS